MKQLFFFLNVFLLFTNCKKNEDSPKTSQTEITTKVNQLYALDRSVNRYFPKKNLFSPELERLLSQSNRITDADIERIKKSDHPTDMPIMLVSYLMTDLQDTNTGFKIKKIAVNGNTGEAFTEFYYDNTQN